MERPIESGEDSEREEEPTDIFICPPEANILSEEDSTDEDSGGLIDNLSGRQLSGSADFVTDGLASVMSTEVSRLLKIESGRLGEITI